MILPGGLAGIMCVWSSRYLVKGIVGTRHNETENQLLLDRHVMPRRGTLEDWTGVSCNRLDLSGLNSTGLVWTKLDNVGL